MAQKPNEAMEIYHMTREAIKTDNETLWFKVSLRLAKIYLETAQFDELNDLIARLKYSCRRKDKDHD